MDQEISASFESLVMRELKDEEVSQSEQDMLYARPDEWRQVLSAKVREVDLQMTERKARLTAENKPEYDDWRTAAMRFKMHLIGRLQEVKTIQIRHEESKHRPVAEILENILDKLDAIYERIIEST